MAKCRISYTSSESVFVIKLKGKVCFNSGSTLDHLIEHHVKPGDHTYFILDLSNTEHLDSTVIGLFTLIHDISITRTGRIPAIVAGPGYVYEQLMEIGINRLFSIIHPPLTYDSDFTEVEEHTYPREKLRSLILSSHQNLMEINERNRERFRDVIRALMSYEHSSIDFCN